MHLVFYSDIYGNFKDAVSKPDGLVVIGVFLQVVFVLCFFLNILINLFNFWPFEALVDKLTDYGIHIAYRHYFC